MPLPGPLQGPDQLLHPARAGQKIRLASHMETAKRGQGDVFLQFHSGPALVFGPESPFETHGRGPFQAEVVQ